MYTNLKPCNELHNDQDDTLHVDALLHLIIEVVKEYSDAEGASLLLHDPATDELYFDVAVGGAGPQIKRIRMRRSTGVAGHVFETMQPLLVSEVDCDPHFSATADHATGFRTRSIIAMPLLDSEHRRIGVVEAVNRRGRPRFNDIELSRLLKIQQPLSDAVSAAQRVRAGQVDAVSEFYTQILNIVEQRAQRVDEGSRELAQAQHHFEANCSRIVREARIAGLCLFVAGLSHEMNNPIGFTSANLRSLGEMLEDARAVLRQAESLVAAGASSVAVMQALEVGKVGEILDDARDCSGEVLLGLGRLAHVVQRLNSFSNLTVQRHDSVDFNEVVRTVLQRLAIQHPGRRIHFEPVAVPALLGSRVHLEQVVLDLLDNALKNSTGQDEVRVELEHAAGEVVLTVCDTGRGIAPDKIDHIFDPFYTDKQSDWRGTGLGLASVHGIVMAHGGRVEVRSVLGEGATFSVSLPLTPDAHTPTQAQPPYELSCHDGEQS